jgi:threonine dehydratase
MITLQDVLHAQNRIRPYLARTPLHRYAAIDDLIGTATYIKHENYHPVGAFKVRGGINLLSQMDENERRRGLIAASTGNHGQSIAYAGKLFNAPVKIVVPEGANAGKVEAMRGMGAEVILHGAALEQSLALCQQLTDEHGYRFVNNGNEPHLLAGVATYMLEILQDMPDIDTVIVPVGSGGGAAGVCIAAKAINPKISIIAVQSEASPAAYLSWKNKTMEKAPNQTDMEGLATGTGFAMPQEILQRDLDDFILLSDDAILQAMAWMVEKAHTLAEGAGAAALAGAYALRSELKSKNVAVICSGGNVRPPQLAEALTRYSVGVVV